jgi:MFS transporter, DHA3 family, macrolide efflux protein
MHKNKNIWILMSGEFIAGIGMWIGIIGNLEFLQNQVPSDFMKSLILFSGLFIGVLFGPFAGRVIDQYSKRKIMIYAGLVRIISVFFMFLAISQENVLWMVVYMMGIGISAAFYFPALQAAIPLIVKDNQLLTLNGIHMNVGTIARIMGTAVAGLLVLYMELFSIYFYTLLSYIAILICSIGLNINEEKKTEVKKETKVKGFKEIWPIISQTPSVLTALFLMLIPISFIGSFNLMVLKISEMQGDPSIKGLLYTTEGISLMLSTFFVRKFSNGKNIIPILISSALLIAVAHLSLYFADIKILSIISFAIFGLAAGSFFPLSATLFQKQVEKQYHGRFFSFRNMMDRVLFQVVLLFTGLFLDTIGFKYMVLCFGGLSLFLVGFLSLRQWKTPVSYIQENKQVQAN